MMLPGCTDNSREGTIVALREFQVKEKFGIPLTNP